jgi:hypothetical protein
MLGTYLRAQRSFGASTDWVAPTGLDPGGRQLIEGIGRAPELRRLIDWAVGCIAELHTVCPEGVRIAARGGQRLRRHYRTARRLLAS